MIWLTWRQFRTQAAVVVAVLAALTVWLLVLGRQIRHTYDLGATCAGCTPESARGVLENKYAAPMSFAARNIVPLGYAAFAVLAGITIGLLVRRTVLAMAITLALFTALQILMPTVIRPHLQTPVTAAVAFAADGANGLGMNAAGDVSVQEYEIPGAWNLSPDGRLYDAQDKPVTRESIQNCMTGQGPDKDFPCLEALNLHMSLTYQPADRYWTFQWLEFGAYLLLAALLAGFAFWRIPRGLS
ncbi:hypothetical protein ACWKSP_02120 [Micromonosporaceae bacterium Da 78-11]